MLVKKLFWLHIYSTMLKMCFIYDILRKCTIYLYRFWFERWILCHGNSGHFSSKMRTNSKVDFICSYCLNLAILRECLHDTGATFAPARVHSCSLSWLYICLHDNTTKRQAGASHLGVSWPRLLYRGENFTPVRNLATVSCKRETTTRFGVNSVCRWPGTGSACVMFAILNRTCI